MTFLSRRIPAARLSRNNMVLLVCLLVLILFYPILSTGKEFLRAVILTGVVLASMFSLNFNAGTRKVLIASGGTTIVLLWISVFFHSPIWDLSAFINLFVYQIFILFFMIRHGAVDFRTQAF